MIAAFGFQLPVRIQFGEGASSALPDVLSELGSRRPVAIADEAVAGMIASQCAAPSFSRWSKKLAGYSFPRAMPCRSG